MRRLGIPWRAFRRPLAAGSAAAGAEGGGRSAEAPPRFDAAMRDHIETALSASYGRIEGPLGAAVRLGVNPHTLRARMRKLGINWRRYRVKQ
jgi:hydrogenase-4 transcriptional activator